MIIDTDPPIPALPPEEPSVLDYVRSRLQFWKRAPLPVLPERAPEPQPPAPADMSSVVQGRVPWRSLAALALALAGQRLFEPASRAAGFGLALYVLSAGLLIWGSLRGEWRLAEASAPRQHEDPQTFRRVPMLLAAGLALLAFLFMGGNRFTAWNVLLWLGAIASFIWAFWVKAPEPAAGWQRFSGWFRRREWQIKITPWLLLVVLVSAVVIFFRVYHLAQTPAEPFSDHAEKILDVYDITQGQTHIFFERNTGREAFQMYLTVAVAWLFGSGLSFMSLKIGTVLCGLATLPYLFLLGKEIGNRRVGLLAVFLASIAYWPNVIARVGLRFPLYALFAAPTLYYLIRGLRSRNRNDFILSGLFLGLGLHGYSPFRIVPVIVLVAVGIFLAQRSARGSRRQVLVWLSILVLASVVVFLPLLRYAVENPQMFSYRALTRLDYASQDLADPAGLVLLQNLWNAARMFNWDNGVIWVHSVPNRPALDVVTAAFLLLGILLLLLRYARRRDWLDLFLLFSIPLLQLPSSLALAFPGENPALNRAGGAMVPVFLVAALAVDGLFSAFASGRFRRLLTAGVGGFLLIWTMAQNYDLVFRQFDAQFRLSSWNSSEMGAVIEQFGQTYGTTDTAWIVPSPHWVDTRLPGVWAGIPNRDFAIERGDLPGTANQAGPKLFLVRANASDPALNDSASLDLLRKLYPQGEAGLYESDVVNHDFWIFFVP